jgi:hypothetical protein
MAELVINTPQSKESVDLNETPFTIGRQEENNYTFQDPRLSRRHCVIRRQEGEFLIEDLDSKNGTIVNGVETDQNVLQDGDRIEVGNLDIRFQLTDDDRAERSSSGGRSSSSKSDRPERLVRWVNPFQITTSTTDSSWFLTGTLFAVCAAVLLVIGALLLLQPLQSNNSTTNLLGTSNDVIQDLALWELDGASRQTVDNNNDVFQLALSSDQSQAVAQYTAPVAVNSQSRLEFSCRVSTRNFQGLAGVHVRWIGSDDTTVHEELVLPTREQQAWVRKSSRVLRPPEDAQRIAFSLFAYGNQGIALFDEPVLRQSTTSGPADQRPGYALDSFPLSVDRSGQLFSTGSSGARLLQSGLRFWKNGKPSAGWTTSLLNRREQNGEIRWSGTAFTPIGFNPVNVQLSLRESPTELTYSLPPSVRTGVDKVGFQFRYRTDRSETSVRVLTEDERIPVQSGQSYSSARGIEFRLAPKSVLFQFSHPLSVRARSDGANTRVIQASMPLTTTETASRGNGQGDGLRFGLKIHPADRKIRTTTRQTNRTPGELRTMIQAGEYGRALTILQDLQPFAELEENQASFKSLHPELIRRIDATVNRVRESLQAARELNSATFLENALDRVKQLRERLGTHQADWDLATLQQNLEEARSNIGPDGDETQVTELYDTFSMYRDAGRTALARKLASEIVQRAPSTEQGAEARSFLKQNSESDKETRNGNGNSN